MGLVSTGTVVEMWQKSTCSFLSSLQFMRSSFVRLTNRKRVVIFLFSISTVSGLTMANFGGHAIPGTFFLLFGLWLTVKNLLRYFWRTRHPKGRGVPPPAFKKMCYTEGGLAVFASFVGQCRPRSLCRLCGRRCSHPCRSSAAVPSQVSWWSSLCLTDLTHISTTWTKTAGWSWWTGSTAPCICSLASTGWCCWSPLPPTWCRLLSTAWRSPSRCLLKVSGARKMDVGISISVDLCVLFQLMIEQLPLMQGCMQEFLQGGQVNIGCQLWLTQASFKVANNIHKKQQQYIKFLFRWRKKIDEQNPKDLKVTEIKSSE